VVVANTVQNKVENFLAAAMRFGAKEPQSG
jgi:hypothetical protein